MKRYVCVHAHFYQPPRGNPWDEDRVPLQRNAAPFHDWNERITHECYRPFSAAHILGEDGKIEQVVNLFSRTNFNVGPTLLQWMELNAKDTYRAIVDGDAVGKTAIAQAFNHTILPLASLEDKRLQVRWGMEDFERRFQRKAEGMWLPECAVDCETLEVLCDHGIKFTVLAPSSASLGNVNPCMPYRVPLRDGRSMSVFFYNGPLSRAVAFERLLDDGARLAAALKDAAAPFGHIATDGESYGHHHRHGEMALAYALKVLDADPDVSVVSYAAYLAEHPAQQEMRIKERTSWSCEHGLGRWERDCGCNTGRHAGANQAWRGPLRDAIDGLARALSGLKDASVVTEVQRAYTSCAWFFDDPSDLETLQVLAYAARALELAGQVGASARPAFLRALSAVKSVDGRTGPELFFDVIADQALEARIEAWKKEPRSRAVSDALAEAVEKTRDKERLRDAQRAFQTHALDPQSRLGRALGF
jgi:Glycosyl hydrolase family 57/Domain of unknown function (DUF3536)